jgi:hypothetical protein
MPPLLGPGRHPPSTATDHPRGLRGTTGVSIYDPDLDPDGRYAAALADSLVEALQR